MPKILSIMVRVQENINHREQLHIDNQAKKVLEEIKSTLKKPLSKYCCMVKDEKDLAQATQAYYQIIGSNSLASWQKLTSYYQDNSQEWLVIQDLKDKLEKIKNNEFPNYNQKLALSACDYLTERE